MCGPQHVTSTFSGGISSGGVTFTPGGTVTVERMPLTSLRLSFSLVDPEELDEGVRRLARALREVRRRERYSATVPVS